MSEWDILTAMGWTVVESERMTDHGCLVHGQMVALVRAGLDPADRETVGAQLLSRALSRDAPPRLPQPSS